MKSKFAYYGKMDPLIVPLCDTLNSIRGVRTLYSCSGHPNYEGFTDGMWRGTYIVMQVRGSIKLLHKLKEAFDHVRLDHVRPWSSFSVTLYEGQTDEPDSVRVNVELIKRKTIFDKGTGKWRVSYPGFTEEELKRCLRRTIKYLKPLKEKESS